jgi:hypothetical protein
MLDENPLECGHIAALVTGKLHTQVDRLLVPLHIEERLGLIGNRVADGQFEPVLRIRIHRIHMFLGLPDPDQDPLVRGMDPDPALDPDWDPSTIMQK